jgi:ABC-type transport system involved in multi-copper enzyme maturation permease subunit
VIGLIPAEIKRQIGRKGSFLGATAWIAIFGLGLLIWVVLSSKDSGAKAIDNGSGLIIFATALASIVLGATAGAYDVDQGIMRYLVMTGRPRWQLVFVRVPGLVVTIVLVTLPSLLLILLASALAPGPAASGSDYFDLVYGAWMTGILYGLLSLAIGMFLKSNGVAIAVAVVLNFAGLLIAGAIYENVSHALGNAFYPIVAGTVIQHQADTGQNASFSLATSIVLVLVWLGVLCGAAFARVQRAEY